VRCPTIPDHARQSLTTCLQSTAEARPQGRRRSHGQVPDQIRSSSVYTPRFTEYHTNASRHRTPPRSPSSARPASRRSRAPPARSCSPTTLRTSTANSSPTASRRPTAPPNKRHHGRDCVFVSEIRYHGDDDDGERGVCGMAGRRVQYRWETINGFIHVFGIEPPATDVQ
jgi:hypothetical protein